MEIFSALLAICAWNSPVPGEFLAQRPVTRSFDVFFDLRLNKRLSIQSWGWWFGMRSRSLWRHCNAFASLVVYVWDPNRSWDSFIMGWIKGEKNHWGWDWVTTNTTNECFYGSTRSEFWQSIIRVSRICLSISKPFQQPYGHRYIIGHLNEDTSRKWFILLDVVVTLQEMCPRFSP